MQTQLVVIMVEGSLESVAERERWLELYKYQNNSTDPDRWDLLSSSADDDGAALIIKDDGERIELVSESSTNVTQACYIAARFGWKSCQIVEAPSQEVYRNFVERLNIEMVEPTEINARELQESVTALADPFSSDTFALEGDEAHTAITATLPTGQGVHTEPLVFDLDHEETTGTFPLHEETINAVMHSAEEDTIHDIQVLTIRANDAEMNVDRLEDALLKSQTEVQQLRLQLADQQRKDVSGGTSINVNSPMIIQVLERHIADLLSGSIGKHVPLVSELETLGLNCNVSVSLSPATETHR